MALIGRDLEAFVKKLSAEGVVPLECCRIVIDIPVGGIVRVLYECYGDEKIASEELADLIGGVAGERMADVKPKCLTKEDKAF